MGRQRHEDAARRTILDLCPASLGGDLLNKVRIVSIFFQGVLDAPYSITVLRVDDSTLHKDVI